ncbi:MAG: ribonuclease III [Clostridia bacterium]|jgi:ribonuclease-3 family protein|nr:ribonuclease III [Clostridia bacterium]
MEDIKNYTGIVLAYIGDAVYELEVRKALIEKGYYRGNRLHKEAIRRVNAPMQSRLILSILNDLTPEEADAFRRGRNTKPKYIPKQSNITEYTNATGLESLMGYLYLKEDKKRISEIISRLEELLDEDEKERR